MTVDRDYKKNSSQPVTSVQSNSSLGSLLQTRVFAYPKPDVDQPSSVTIASRSSESLLTKLISQGINTSSSPQDQAKPSKHFKTLPSHRKAIQAKLQIGKPNDKYEQEADRTAVQVVQQINTPIDTANKQSIQRRSLKASQEQAQGKLVKPKPPKLQPLIPKLQRKEPSRQASQLEEETTNLESSIQSKRGSGHSLEPSLRLKMSQAMGADFSNVRVHTDSESDRLNKSIQAKAFTTGEDVFFQQGQYNPSSREGQELIAHELTHVMQQSGTRVSSDQTTVHKAPDQIQRLISRDNFVALSGNASNIARFNSSTYTKILQNLKKCETENNEERKKEIYTELKTLCERWLESHATGMGSKGVTTYLPNSDSDSDNIKVGYIAGLLKDVLAALGEPHNHINSDSTPSTIEQNLLGEINTEEEKASVGVDGYRLTLIAAVQNPYLIDFAKKRLALTIENKRKFRSKNKKTNEEIKSEAAKQVLEEKESDKFGAMSDEEKLKAVQDLAQASSAVGHTWVSLVSLDAAKNPLNKHSFGFYPKNGYGHPTVPVPGEVVYPDNLHANDPMQLALDYNLNKNQYTQALEFAKKQRLSPPQYQLTGYNCTFFAKKVVETAGQAFPGNAFMTVPSGAVSAITGLGKDKAFNPNALYDQLTTYDGSNGGQKSYAPERLEPKKKELTSFEKISKCVVDWGTKIFTLKQSVEEKYAPRGSSKQTFEGGEEIQITDASNGRFDNEIAINKVNSKDDEHWVDADVLYNAIADQVMDIIGG